MRRALAFSALIALSTAGSAYAQHWTKFADGANGIEWSYDADYIYKDKATGRLVVMQAISKPSANLMPSGPPTGVGSVYAVDCEKKNIINMGGYKPSATFSIPESWRSDTPKKLGGPEDEALVAAVCAKAGSYPVK
ncbi:hypothetical protein [Phenylobacterium sp.]|uniref:hypothetical protein n=1 Tax=Phenylobacterium sp. TaxID=1871053 RepID=UPI002C4D2202|nr:hypothetical protein [Phenylobacterium sp.]HLZ75363.1 hypothetical protein [Phenylobacterium sp.]